MTWSRFIATKRWPACSPAWLPAPATTPLVQTWRTSANEEEERLAAKGASDAFNRFGDLLERTFA